MNLLGRLALACLAFDSEFPVDSKSPYLPKCLLDRAWYGEFEPGMPGGRSACVCRPPRSLR
uniref:Immunity 49 family protein n=1 Tax=Streptomyces sp. NBC_00119 TaxID=2975659 RepID=A0AAU1UPE7_9ACTN